MNDQEFRDHVVGSLARIEQSNIQQNKRLVALEHTLHGNGDRGLKDRVTRLEERDGGTVKRYGIAGAIITPIAAALAAAIDFIFMRGGTSP